MYAKVEELRLTYNHTIHSAVYYTPIEGGDQAHADLTFTPWAHYQTAARRICPLAQ
jgi:hypothetical protein